LQKHHFEPTQIVMEITEQYSATCEQEIEGQCKSLQKLGFKLAIDDFGSGLSNLSMLEIIKPDFIKISGRFIQSVHTDKTRQKIIKNILMLAEDFGISAIVESIECQEQWRLVSELGASLAQGFHFYRPMPNTELEALL
jgi:EAL domain-containing protein (putative c-di-GMP-specific phosphodiesterase class I)